MANGQPYTIAWGRCDPVNDDLLYFPIVYAGSCAPQFYKGVTDSSCYDNEPLTTDIVVFKTGVGVTVQYCATMTNSDSGDVNAGFHQCNDA